MVLNDTFKYAHRRYRVINDARHLVGLRPTIRPHLGETNQDFQERIARMEELLRRDGRVREIEVDFRWSDESIVECIVDVVLIPEPAPIEADARPAGGRTGARGKRGSGVKLCLA